jgi:hypothetical protein
VTFSSICRYWSEGSVDGASPASVVLDSVVWVVLDAEVSDDVCPVVSAPDSMMRVSAVPSSDPGAKPGAGHESVVNPTEVVLLQPLDPQSLTA